MGRAWIPGPSNVNSLGEWRLQTRMQATERHPLSPLRPNEKAGCESAPVLPALLQASPPQMIIPNTRAGYERTSTPTRRRPRRKGEGRRKDRWGAGAGTAKPARRRRKEDRPPDPGANENTKPIPIAVTASWRVALACPLGPEQVWWVGVFIRGECYLRGEGSVTSYQWIYGIVFQSQTPRTPCLPSDQC